MLSIIFYEITGRTLVALTAIELKAKHRPSPLRGGHPGPVDPGWRMTHMLIVAARQLCNPVVFLVFMIASDGLFHKLQSRKRPGWPNRFRNHPRQKPEKGIGPDGHQCGYRNDRPT